MVDSQFEIVGIIAGVITIICICLCACGVKRMMANPNLLLSSRTNHRFYYASYLNGNPHANGLQRRNNSAESEIVTRTSIIAPPPSYNDLILQIELEKPPTYESAVERTKLHSTPLKTSG